MEHFRLGDDAVERRDDTLVVLFAESAHGSAPAGNLGLRRRAAPQSDASVKAMIVRGRQPSLLNQGAVAIMSDSSRGIPAGLRLRPWASVA